MIFSNHNQDQALEYPFSADYPIDFVITYVDDSDPIWREKRQKYLSPGSKSFSKNYRSWDNLHYWFRCAAKFAPWVHKIFLVTDHQVPDWLETGNEKIVTVSHEDYIPEQYLPVFSANPIELNLHRIAGISDHFVFFNDDTFLVSETEPSYFFRNGLPCDYPVEMPFGAGDPVFAHILSNDIQTINKKYKRREVLKKHREKFYSDAYEDGMKNNRYFSLLRTDSFFGFVNTHLPTAMLKSAYESVWEEFRDDLERTCKNRFRTDTDVNQYIIQYWMYVHGLFHPFNWKKAGRAFQLNDSDSGNNNIEEACSAILSRQLNLICVNDALIENFESSKEAINTALQSIVPEVCEFEKGFDPKISREKR